MSKRSRLGSYGRDGIPRAHAPEELAALEAGERSVRQLSSIQPRAGGDSRGLRAAHVMNLARSISALGLLEPLVIDESDRLLAGGHRVAACRLLAAGSAERHRMLREMCRDARIPGAILDSVSELEAGELDPMAIPVRVMPFRAEDEPDRALAIEAAENTQRRAYSPEETRELYQRLLDRGYTDRPGRPRHGEKAAKPVLAAVVGRSQRQIERLLTRAKTPTHVGVFAPISIRLAVELSKELRALCEARGQDPASLVIELVEKFVHDQRSAR